MRKALLSVAALLLGVGLLQLGSSLLSTLIGIRLAQGGVPTTVAGFVTAAYFAGLVLGSLFGHLLIQGVGHIRAFAAYASLFSAATLAHGFFPHAAVWGGLRMVEGVCMAGLLMVTESWLNERSDNSTRGAMLSAYTVAIYFSQGTGQFLLNLQDPSGFALFALVSILLSVALVPVAATRIVAPPIPAPSHFGPRQLMQISPLGVAGSFGAGLVMGAFYSLAPFFAQTIGLSVAGTAEFMAVTILGGLLIQWPLGYLSDRIDRRTVIAMLCVGVGAVSVGMAVAAATGGPGLLVLAAFFGGAGFTLYPMAVAHANDHVDAADLVPAAGGMLLAYSVGASVGPPVAGGIMAAIGPVGLFVFTAAVGMLLTAFTFWRMRQRPAPPLDEQSHYQALPRTTPVVGELDPRGESEEQYSLNL